MIQKATEHLIHSQIQKWISEQISVDTQIDDSGYPIALVPKPDIELEPWQFKVLMRAKKYVKDPNTDPVAKDDIQLGTDLLRKLLPTETMINRFTQICSDNRILLDVTTPDLELSALPWEACVHADWDKLGVKEQPDKKIAVVRTPYMLREAWSTIRQVRILIAGVSPDGSSTVNFDKEARRIKDILANIVGSPSETDRYRYLEVREATIEKLKQQVSAFKPHIVHLVSHGGLGELYLETTLGKPISVSGFELRESLEKSEGSICLFISTACMAMSEYTDKRIWGLGHELAKAIPAVIGMQIAISEEVAMAFTEALYSSLAASDPIIVAYTKARERILQERPGSPEWIAPVLYRGAYFNDPLFVPEEIPSFLGKTLRDLDDKLGVLKGNSSLTAIKNLNIWNGILRIVNRADVVLLGGLDKILYSPTDEQRTLIENLEEPITELRGLLIEICSLLEAKEEDKKVQFEFGLSKNTTLAITKITIFRRKLNSIYMLYKPSGF